MRGRRSGIHKKTGHKQVMLSKAVCRKCCESKGRVWHTYSGDSTTQESLWKHQRKVVCPPDNKNRLTIRIDRGVDDIPGWCPYKLEHVVSEG